jgi:hypothetical protein
LFFSTKIIVVIQSTHSGVFLVCNLRGEKMRKIWAGKVYGEETNISSQTAGGDLIVDSFEDMGYI